MDEVSRQARWEQRTEIPLAFASLVFLALYAVLVLAQDLSGAWRDLCTALMSLAWLMFAVDYGVRWWLSGQGLRFVPTHKVDTAVVVLPLLRPLRVVKLYEAIQRRHGEPRLSLYARVIAYAGLTTVLLGFACSLAVYDRERGAPGSEMHSFGDALWWACATLTTVGYGDVVPVTTGGRTIAVGLMACGLALLGAVTGSFSSWLVQVFSLESDRGDGDGPPGS
ncbi:potassium channel family protein [Streptomyces sp. NPDC096132]|uniref:potassium channel family protein n=1 Tax=Streptomyces sp. NPDC096132 TaxID=3366075 RepID=UPI003802C649